MKPLVRTASLNGYVELGRSVGIDPQPLLRQVGLDAAALAVPDRWIAGAAAVQLLELSAGAARRPDFGLLLAEYRRLSTLGPIGLVIREEPDVRSALALLLRHEHMYNELLHIRLSEAHGLATLKVTLDLGEELEHRQATELAVAALHRVVRGFLGERWQSLTVCFTHPAPPGDAGTHRRLFGPHVEFDREFDGFVFYASELDSPNALADPQLRTYARQYFEAIAVPRDTAAEDRVRELIEVLLPTGRCSVEQIAHSLGVDRRTVHRRLAEAGQTFSSLLGATRRQLAEQLVASPRRSLTEISGLLGFASPSAFSRWFGQQFGCSAREWRARRASERAADR
ncbi:AraC family transcriptional regulator ligand-binding domain-containing protein [Streptacidiphilus neutrinimicus]|uniref:AraC family transcriptional regulator ligand-binding domain-containing protein n=1 Tax=Streptacidiphilus neutrinimicus TaxID=105420 RepID=UPI0005AB75F3|nr:AraC family transcriptional regulator ligand-binding domain-containing protein [Streptacidiphilus neutrinimicus]